MTPNFVRLSLLHQAAVEAVGPVADKPTELLHSEEIAKVAAWMGRNGHWNSHECQHVRDEQDWLAHLEQAALKRSDAPWRMVLDISDRDITAKQVQQAYQAKAMTAHPDRGGTDLRMQRLNRARDQALAELAEPSAA